MSFHIVIGDLFDQGTDAIVLTTAPNLRLEGKIGSKAKQICGLRLQMDLEQIKSVTGVGECVIVDGYNLPCKKIIMVVTPRCSGKQANKTEKSQLEDSYENCLLKALDYELNSISFPLLSAGANSFPEKTALKIAIDSILSFLQDNPNMEVNLIIKDEKIWNNYESIIRHYLIGEPVFVDDIEDDYARNDNYERMCWFTPDTATILDKGSQKTVKDKIKFYMKKKCCSEEICASGVIYKHHLVSIINGKTNPPIDTVMALGLNMSLNEDELNDLISPLRGRLDDRNLRDHIILEEIEREKGLQKRIIERERKNIKHPDPNNEFDQIKDSILERINKRLKTNNLPLLKTNEYS